MGIYANVSLIEKTAYSFASEEEAVDSVKWMLENITPSEEEALRRFVSAHFVPIGRRWKLNSDRLAQWAVIRWSVDGKQ